MIAPHELLLRPRRSLDRCAERPRLGASVAVVLTTGVASLCLNLLATVLEPRTSRGGGVAVSLALPVLFVLFWVLGTWMVGAGATLMGAERKRRDYLAVSGQTFPVLILYAALAVVQAATLRWGGIGGTVSDMAGFLSLPILLWFLALSTLAAQAVYRVSMMAAVALALLPFATLSAAVLILIIVVTALRI
jgi:hypothetical protein